MTIDEIISRKEDQTFDCKSKFIKFRKLGNGKES